ncbi:MAG: PrsW family glutamic-type intramembrane protease [Candidatus Moranbacteria bacterium]|nr:PrsW family glutamic-type intramembrane protease [Candidatus Moranbacteria bacterium]
MPFIVIILFGALASSFALILELLSVSLLSLPDQTLFTAIPFTFDGVFSLESFFILLGIAFIEETTKYIFLRQYSLRFFARGGTSFNHSLILGTLFGLGFAILETLFVLNTSTLHSSFAVPGILGLHIATSIAFALFLFSPSNSSPQEPKKRQFGSLSLISAALVFHTLYNLAILLLF